MVNFVNKLGKKCGLFVNKKIQVNNKPNSVLDNYLSRPEITSRLKRPC